MEQAWVNPQHIKAVPGRKNDRRGLNCFERGFIPPTPIQDLRDLTRYRAELRQSQNRVANCIQKFSEQANLKQKRSTGRGLRHASGLRQADQRLSNTARARLTFSRTSDALAVQTKGLGWSLCLSM